MAERIQFQIPEEVPEDFRPGEPLFVPSQFYAPDPDTAEPAPPGWFSAPDPDTAEQPQQPQVVSSTPRQRPFGPEVPEETPAPDYAQLQRGFEAQWNATHPGEPAPQIYNVAGQPRPPLQPAPVTEPFTAPPPETAEADRRGAWQQRVDSLARGIVLAQEQANLLGMAVSAMAIADRQDAIDEFVNTGVKRLHAETASFEHDLEAQIQRKLMQAKHRGTEFTEQDAEAFRQQERQKYLEKLQERADRSKKVFGERGERIAFLQDVLSEIPQSEVMRKFEESPGGFFPTMRTLLTNPTLFLDLNLESLPASGVGMIGGAAAGTIFGPVGTMAGAFAGAVGPETAARMMEVMQDSGVDMRDPKSIEAFLSDPRRRASAIELGLLKGVTIATVNAFFAGIGGRFLGPALKQGGAGRVALAGIKEAAVQIPGEGVGELMGEVASGQKPNWKDIIAESAAGVVEHTQQVLTNTIEQVRSERKARIDKANALLEQGRVEIARAALEAEQLAAQQEQLRKDAANIGSAAVENIGQQQAPDAEEIARVQRQITDETNTALDAQEELTAYAESLHAQTQVGAEATAAGNAILNDAQTQQLGETEKNLTDVKTYLDTAAELEKTNPEAAAMMRFPKAADAFEAQRDDLKGNSFVQIENEDGTREPATFAGYWMEGMPAIGHFDPERARFSHGMLKPGQKLVTPVPSFAEWTANQEAQNQAAQATETTPQAAVTPEGAETQAPSTTEQGAPVAQAVAPTEAASAPVEKTARITEQEARIKQSEAIAAKRRKRAGEERRQLARVADPADGTPDILSDIRDYGGVPARKRGPEPGEYNGFAESFHGIARFLVVTKSRGSKYGAGQIDTWLDGFKDAFPEYRNMDLYQFYDAVYRAVNRRKALAEQMVTRQALERFEQSLLSPEKKTKRRSADNPVPVGSLAVGDQFTIDGEKFIVTELDPDTNEVTVQDGYTYKLPDGTEIYPDKGSLVPLGRINAEFFTPEEQAQREAELAAERAIDEGLGSLATTEEATLPEGPPEPAPPARTPQELAATGEETREQERALPSEPSQEEQRAGEEESVFEEGPAYGQEQPQPGEPPPPPSFREKMRALKAEITALLPRAIIEHTPLEELLKLNRTTARRLAQLYAATPPTPELVSVALLGAKGRHWYTDFRAYLKGLGIQEKDRWILNGVLAATSPNKSTVENMRQTMEVLRRWDAAGRPTERAAIDAALGDDIPQFTPTERGNTIAVLSAPNFETAFASMSSQSPKVKPFYQVLMGDDSPAVLDTHMARLFGVRATKVSKANMNRALSTAIKVAAKKLGWTTAETQAAMWSVSRYYAKRLGRNLARQSPDSLASVMRENVTDAALHPGDDFATLLDQYAPQITDLGFGDPAGGRREVDRVRAARPRDPGHFGSGGGRTFGTGHQRSFGRRFEARLRDDLARRRGQEVADDRVAEAGAAYGDSLEIEDQSRREGATDYVADVDALVNEDSAPYGFEDEGVPVAAPQIDIETEIFLTSGQSSEGVRARLAAGETLAAVLHKLVNLAVPAFNITGKRIRTVRDFVAAQLALRSPYQESVKFAFLDEKGKVIHSGVLSVGSISSSIVDNRSVLNQWARARALGATKPRLMIAHNHPSGVTQPSSADISVAHRLKGLMEDHNGHLVDFVVTDGEDFFSLAQSRTIPLGVPHRAAWEAIPAKMRYAINGPARVASLVADLRQGNPLAQFLIFTDQQGKVVGVSQVPTEATPYQWEQRAFEQGAEVGAASVAIVTSGNEFDAAQVARRLSAAYKILDLSTPSAASWYESPNHIRALSNYGVQLGERPRSFQSGVAEEQLGFGFDDDEAKAAAPHPVAEPKAEPPAPAVATSAVQAAATATGNAPDSTVPLTQQQPSTSIPGHTADTSHADIESIDAEGLQNLENAAPEDLARVPTRVFGRKFTVLGRRGGPEERARAISHAGQVFSDIGLNVTYDPQNEVYRLTDPNTPQEALGRDLVARLRAELAEGSAGPRPLLSVLINSVRNRDGGLSTAPAFSERTRRELFSLAQSEASFYGLLLGALAKAKRSLSFAAEHVDVFLHKVWSDQFGGEQISKLMDVIRKLTADLAAAQTEGKLTDKMRRTLDRLDTAHQQGVDFDYFINQVLDLIGQGKRVRPKRPKIAQLPSLFDLANWRLFITQRGGNQLADQVMRFFKGEQDHDTDGGQEGNVKRMDRLLQSDLRQILKEILPKIEKERQQPNFLQELMVASGDLQSRVERLDVLDTEVRRRIDEMENAELERGESDPDEIHERFELMREKWDEYMPHIQESLGSEQIMRRIINQHLKPIFERTGLSWRDVLEGRITKERLRSMLMDAVTSNFDSFNQQAPEAAINAQRTEQLLDYIREAFDDYVAQKEQEAYARKLAAAAKRKGELPQRTAQAELNRLATLHSDTQQWTETEENAVRDAIKAQRENPVSTQDFEQTLLGLGVRPETAATLSRIITRDIEVRRRHAQWRKEERIASPRPERGPIDAQERKSGIKGLIERIFSATPQQQNDPRWQERNAIEYFIENGLAPDEARDAWLHFKPDFIQLLRQSARRGLEQMRKNLSRRERALLNSRRSSRVGKGMQLWQRIERALNAGVFDSDDVLREFAREFGWNVPSQVQIDQLKALSVREQNLSQLSEDERAAIGDDPQALAAAQAEKAAATLSERLRLQNQMHTLFATFTRPITYRTAEGRINAGEAMRERISSNMLLKLGFGVKQVIDVTTQFAVHVPFRAFGQVITRHREAIAAGDPTAFWADLSASMGDSLDTFFQFALQALQQAKQALRGEGVRRNVEGLRSTISSFDRARNEVKRLESEARRLIATGNRHNVERAADLATKAAILQFSNLAEYALKFTRAMDALQGIFVEQQEIRERLINELQHNGFPDPVAARTRANEILMDWRREQDLALLRTAEIAAQNGIELHPNDLRANAYEVFKARQFSRMRAASLDANAINEYAENQRQVVGWNMPEETGIGGAVGAIVRAPSKVLQKLGAPIPLGQFSNAIAIGINRALTWSGLGHFPSWFGGVDPKTGLGENFWFRTEQDRQQRKMEANMGLLMGGMFVAAMASGLIRVWIKPPDDPEERELWQKEGHRAGTVEFAVGKGRFIPVSLTSGPISLFRIPLTAVAAMQDVADSVARRRSRAKEEAQRKGVPVGELPEITASDLGAAASLGAFVAITGGRTAGGALRSLRAGTESDLPTVKTTIAAQLSPYVVGLPAYQEMQRMLETRIDPKEASVLDLMFPTQGNAHRRYNFLSDELGPGFIQQATQVLTGGSYGMVEPAKLDEINAYRVFRRISYRPSPIERNKALLINGEMRPLTDEEYTRAQFERGRRMKEMLKDVDAEQDPRALTRRVIRIASQSKREALNAVRAEEMTAEQLDRADAMQRSADELWGRLSQMAPADAQAAFDAALANGEIPMQNGDVDPDFLREWQRASKQTQPAR